jgi:hypothetical protein
MKTLLLGGAVLLHGLCVLCCLALGILCLAFLGWLF